MAQATHNSAINARRFAALLAGFDVGNGSEEEAISKGRALRRMASESGMRIVDLLELPDIKAAVDAQMQPRRNDSGDLKEAFERAALLEDELKERMQDVTKLAVLLQRQEETSEALRQQLRRAAQPSTSAVPITPAVQVPPVSEGTLSDDVKGGLAILVMIVLVIAFIYAMLH